MTETIQALLIDLSGTVHIENEAVPGVLEDVKLLKEADFLFNRRRTLHEQKLLVRL